MASLTDENELTFLISTFVPNVLGSSLIDTLTSHLKCPFLLSASDIPQYWYTALMYSRNDTASSAECRHGPVTNSNNGLPALL